MYLYRFAVNTVVQ